MQVQTCASIIRGGHGANAGTAASAGRSSWSECTAFTAIYPRILNLREERDIRGQIIPHVDPDPMATCTFVPTGAIQVRVVPALVPDSRLPSDGQIVHIHLRERGVGGDHRSSDSQNGQGQPP